mgnify:CR=1 FL=1
MNVITERINSNRNSLDNTELKIIKLQNKLIDETELIASKIYSDITISTLRKIWNKSDQIERCQMLMTVPDIDEHIKKLESHGGLNYNEIVQDIIEEKWGKAEWLEDADEYFIPFCKK